MKYGLLLFDKSLNIGDCIQTYSIEKAYEKIGIKREEIVYIALEELENYNGEYIILPINSFGHIETLKISPYIFPIYLGYNNTLSLSEENVDFLRKNQPIGCRDEFTFKNMRDHQIDSYICGCYTLTLDKRNGNFRKGKYFFIDTPKELENYIPENVRNNSVYLTHVFESEKERQKFDRMQFYQLAIDRLNKYRQEAKVIVTSRLHCASPCLAMGIPVIVTKQNIDMNLSWIDKFIPLYEERSFSEINWDPAPIDLEQIKENMLLLLEQRIHEVYHKNKFFCLLSEMYENREKSLYNARLVEKLKRIVTNVIGKEDFSYAIWGAGSGGFLAYQIVCEQFPNAILTFAVDKYKKGKFFNVPIILPENVDDTYVDIFFISTYAGRIDAVTILEKNGKRRNIDYTFLLSKEDKQDEYYDGY